jgi:hypothetical protein
MTPPLLPMEEPRGHTEVKDKLDDDTSIRRRE